MSLFNLPVEHKDKPKSEHPWAKIIKDAYANKIKYAHNSIHNPHYPVKEEKPLPKDRIKFTVIGNRVTKEFIYCINLVNGMHKYRPKSFDAPVIRGVTGVEWPHVLNDLKLDFGGLAFCLKTQVAVLYNNKFLGGDEELKELIEKKYIYHLCLDYQKESVSQFARFIKSNSRPTAYMHFSINEENIGTMMFLLYADIVPYTCENFLRLCTTNKGGYAGTPVHRIVKDGWIQCGGFGLKSAELDCENFIVPPDRRGVIGMANDGRHVDCSTQFFILLQPAPWMAHKYVMFGQLIDGESTLQTLETIPTWYESPSSDIVIHKAGILNMDCQDIMINRGAHAYIEGHIENLVTIGELFIEFLMQNIYLEIEFRRIQRLEQNGEDVTEEQGKNDIRATQRFMRRKDEIQKQLEKSQIDAHRPSTAHSKASKISKTNKEDNDEFDVENYYYVPEEYSYQHATDAASLVVREEKPFYIPLTDVPYPREVDSDYDLKKFLRGDYCHEADLDVNAPKKPLPEQRLSYMSEIFHLLSDSDSSEKESVDLDSDEEKEIKNYLKNNVDRVSFAGGIIKNIGKGIGMFNLLENYRKSELITDDELRRFRLASMDIRSRENKKVSISAPSYEPHSKIKRRQTGFVRPEDLENIVLIKKTSSEVFSEEKEEDAPRKVRIAPAALDTSQSHMYRRPTGFVRRSDFADSDMNIRKSVLTRLYGDVTQEDDNLPTLKDYKPAAETHQKNLLLTFSPAKQLKDEDTNDKYLRHSMTVDDSYDQILNVQHGKRATARKVSSDYIKTIGQIEQSKPENSIRSLEYAKTRPSMTVSQYQSKNQKKEASTTQGEPNEMDGLSDPCRLKCGMRRGGMSSPLFFNLYINALVERLGRFGGLRLPGDSPLYGASLSEIKILKSEKRTSKKSKNDMRK